MKVELNGTSCHCASVSLLLASDEWKARQALIVAGELTGISTQPLLAPGFAAAMSEEPGLRAAADKIEPTARFEVVKDKKAEYMVRHHAIGWFRLGWAGEKTGQTAFHATLTINNKATFITFLYRGHARRLKPVQ